MIIYDFYAKGAIALPTEANTPLVINSNAILSFTVTAQLFQPVARRGDQVSQVFCIMQIQQLTSRRLLNIPMQFS
jgi:hypothetical protein